MTTIASPARPERFFADRFGLTQSRLEALVGSAASRVDYADVFIEYQVAEELVLEDGVVKRASRTISQGGGVRAQAGVRTGYAYTDDLDIRHLEVAARQAQAIAEHPGESGPVAVHGSPRPHDLYHLAPGAGGGGPHGQGGAARPGGSSRAGPGSSDPAGHRHARLARADGPHRHVGQLAAGGRAAPDPAERDRGRRGRRAPRGGHLRRGRPRGVRLLRRRRALGSLRPGGGAPGRRQAGRRRGAGGHDDGRARTRLARDPPPRGDRPRARGGLQPEGRLGLHRASGRAGRLRSRHGRRRRDDAQPARLAQRRRRGDAHQPDRPDRERRAARVHAGPAQRAAPGDGAHRQRPAGVVPAPADAAHDEHVHAGRRGAAGGHRSLGRRAGSTRSRSAAGRWTSRAGSSSSRRARPT